MSLSSNVNIISLPSGRRNGKCPSNGIETKALKNHTKHIIMVTVISERKFKYSKAFVMLKYRSTEIRVMFKMDAVHNNTSVAEWT